MNSKPPLKTYGRRPKPHTALHGTADVHDDVVDDAVPRKGVLKISAFQAKVAKLEEVSYSFGSDATTLTIKPH